MRLAAVSGGIRRILPPIVSSSFLPPSLPPHFPFCLKTSSFSLSSYLVRKRWVGMEGREGRKVKSKGEKKKENERKLKKKKKGENPPN